MEEDDRRQHPRRPERHRRSAIRNIQIDDTKIMRDIFAESRIPDVKARTSYSRFADWYVGEIFVDPKAAIPNARRDGFEENDAWGAMRNELDVGIATPYGKQAYRTSKEDKLSLENLTAAVDRLVEEIDLLEAEGNPTKGKLDPLIEEASSLRTRIAQAIRIQEENEIEPLRALAARLGEIQRRLEALLAQVPQHSCDEEIGEALELMAQQLFKTFRERLGPQEWQRAKSIVVEVTGVQPN